MMAMALAGCMRRSGPVAGVPVAPDLDTLAYNRSGPPLAYAQPGAAYDAQYKLDAGDKLRVVVYGQEGLTNSYAIDAGGAITMPLIGRVPARRRTTAGVAGGIGPRPRQRDIPQPLVGRENENYPPCFLFREVAPPPPAP